MALLKDWVTEAAERIYIEQQRSLKSDRPSPRRIAAIIRKHCIFKQDTAYIEVHHAGAGEPIGPNE